MDELDAHITTMEQRVAAYHMLETGADYRKLGETYLDERDQKGLGMSNDDQQNGGRRDGLGRRVSVQTTQDRQQQVPRRPAPGKVTLASKLSPDREPTVQRKAAVPVSAAGGSQGRSLWDLTMDPWMDAAHRGCAALVEKGQDVDPVSNESPAAGQDAPVGLDMTQAVQDPPAESLSLSEGMSAPVEANGLAAPVQAKRRSAPIQANALQRSIQRQEGDQQKKIYVPYRIPITRPMTGEEFKVAAARQVFGAVIEGAAWKNIKDSYSPENSPITLHVEVSLLNRYRGQVNRARGFAMDPAGGISGAGNRARTFQSALASDEKTALLAEIDRRYAAAAGVPQGIAIKPGEAGQAELWRTIRDEVLFQHEYIAKLPRR
jgi:hypothetical protein